MYYVVELKVNGKNMRHIVETVNEYDVEELEKKLKHILDKIHGEGNYKITGGVFKCGYIKIQF